MPALKDLETFKSRFEYIGDELQINLNEGVSKDDYPLPDKEPEQPQAPPEEPADEPGGAFDLNFDDLASISPDALETPLVDDNPASGAATDGAGNVGEGASGAEAGLDLDGLDLSGFGETVNDAEPDAAGYSGADGANSDASDQDASGDETGLDLDGLDLGGFGEAGADPLEVTEVSEEEKASLSLNPEQEDAFSNFDLSIPEDGKESSGLPNLDDLDIPGLDETASKDDSKRPPPIAKDPEINEEDLESLLETLDGYPLALRIACEEIITKKEGGAQVSKLIQLLINKGSAKEAADLAGMIQKKQIPLPRNAIKKTGENLASEQSSFSYVFVQKFLPIITLSLIIALLSACVTYLSYQFIYKPLKADSLYKQGYDCIEEGSFEMANQYFSDAFKLRRVKNWFYKYAEKFRDERQYIYAEQKYDELLYWRPRDKKGALDYARMESAHLHNYEKADRIIRQNILDYEPDDLDGLLALGDINLDWADGDPELFFGRYEEARQAYARYITLAGQTPAVMERMLKYFIRTDNLREVTPIQKTFMAAKKTYFSPETLAELGGYLLDKRLEKTDGVPNEYIKEIEGIKDVLIRAVQSDDESRAKEFKKTGEVPPRLPEPHYQLGRYYHFYNAPLEERQTLETAVEAFDSAVAENPKRARARIDAQFLLAENMINSLEWFQAEEALVKGVNIYEDALERRLIKRPYADAGKLYATLGDIEYFIKNLNPENAIRWYSASERNGWAPPELKYRLGALFYQNENYPAALGRFFEVSMEMPYNRRLLNALGSVSYLRNDFFAAQGYYSRLIRLLERDRARFDVIEPDRRKDHAELLERIMRAQNNMGVTLNALSQLSGSPSFRSQALAMFSESARTWDVLSRGESMVRPGIYDPAFPGKSLPYLNIQHTLYPLPGGESILYMNIDKDVLEDSRWEELASKTAASVSG
ncbi:MAG: tetratricopeptide repeat protein [Spirochaetaceae bacterium]|jgi:tetratricopeptide (TPR) repeat protein|nr:tetratricopeptide repeat protein [Spirochaetaceae bacterium]